MPQGLKDKLAQNAAAAGRATMTKG